MLGRWWLSVACGVAVTAGAAPSPAQAVRPLSAAPAEPGWFDVKLGVEATHATVEHGSPNLASTSASPLVEHLRTTTFDFPIDFAFGAAGWAAFEARVNVRLVNTSPSYGAHGDAAAPPGVHPKAETLAGPTDAWLMARAIATRGGFTASSRLGVTLPIGKTEPDAFTIASEGKNTMHAQFGAGVPRPIAGGAVVFERGRGAPRAAAIQSLALRLDAFGIFSLARDDRGYRAPTELSTHAIGTVALRHGLSLSAGVDVSGATAARWFGAPSLDEPGHAELSVDGGAAWSFSAPWTLELGLRAAAAELASSSGYSTPGTAMLGIATRFDLPGQSPEGGRAARGPEAQY